MKINLPYRISNWLNNQLDIVREKERQEYLHRVATLAPSAQIGPEGSIENTFRDPTRVVLGNNSYCRGRLFTYGHGGKIVFGDDCYIGVRTEIWSMNSIQVGSRVLIAHDVNIHDGTAHSKNIEERHLHYNSILSTGHPTKVDDLPGVYSSPIIIEDDVWISFGVTILRGVHIGRGSVIAAGSLVKNDVPPGVFYRCKVDPIVEFL